MNLLEWSSYQKGQRDSLESSMKQLEKDIDSKNKEKDIYIQVRDLFASVGKATQDMLIQYFENLGTTLLKTIYGDGYKFSLQFEIKRNKSECKPIVIKDNIELSLTDEIGVGVVDVLSFGMRLAIWSLKKPRTDPIFLLDEPFKYVSKDKLSLVGDALRELSEKLGAQIIMISHEEELTDFANSAHKVKIIDNVSEVSRI